MAIPALPMSSDVESAIARIVALSIASSGAGVFSPTNVKDVIANLCTHRRWTLCDENSLPWRPSARTVELLASPSGAASMSGTRAAAPPPRGGVTGGPATQSRYETRATCAAHSVAASVASRHAVAGDSSGRRPATASVEAAAAAATIIRARPAHGETAGPLSPFVAAVSTRTSAHVRRSIISPAAPPPGVSTIGRVALFATLPRAPSVLKESADLQPWMTRMTPRIDTSTFAVTWEDGHLTASLGTRKPDVLHYPKRACRSRFTLAHLGDNKSQNSSGAADFSDDAVAHVTDFLISQAALQRWRHQFIGYLLDGKCVAFFVARFEDSPIRGGPRPLVRGHAVD